MSPRSQRSDRSRLLLRDGRYNVVRRGVPDPRWHDFYYRMLSASWLWLLSVMLVAYLLSNALFALAYLATGDGIENARPGSFGDAFFFSVQTMATIGYGKLVPRGNVANALVTIEALFGLGGLAVATGLLFAKFSRPTARVMFSRNAVVAVRDGVSRIMFRVANERESMIVSAQMSVVLVRNETTREGERIRRFHDLVLERSRTAIFPMSWTVSHILGPDSPLHGVSSKSLEADEVELVCSLTGTEELFASTIHARFSYAVGDIRIGHRLVDILSQEDDGRRSIDYRRFHDTEEDVHAQAVTSTPALTGASLPDAS